MKSGRRFFATWGMAYQIGVIVLIGTILFHSVLLLGLHFSNGFGVTPPIEDERRSMARVLPVVAPAERAAVVAAFFPGTAIMPCRGDGAAVKPGAVVFTLAGGECAIVPPATLAPGENFFPLIVILGSVAVLVPLLSFWAARRVTAPLARLGDSVQHLGESGESDILAEDGPEEIRRVARAYNTMQRQIQALIAGRTRMLAALSHDIRTILTRLLLRFESVPDADIREKGVHDIEIMNAMVASTLAFAQGLEQREALERVDLSSVLETLCDEFTDLDFTVSYEGPANCRYACRLQLLSRGLRNLIDNALKYGGAARVSLSQTADGGIRITVEDDGPGIPEAEHERVFEPFYRLDAARNVEKGGAGLGLAILRSAVGAHGGAISLANRLGGGLRVTVALPASAPARILTPAE